MRREGGRVGAAVGGQGDEGVRPVRGPDADGAVPAAGAEGVLCDEVPADAEDLAIMFLPVLDGEVVERAVEELDAAVAGGRQDLVLVGFGPGKVVETVLGREPGEKISLKIFVKV